MRISFDLDETLFIAPELPTEPELKFPFNRIYKERLRKGAPEFLNRIRNTGFELWVYTTSNRTEKYIRGYFRKYGVTLDGVVNAQRHEREVVRGRDKSSVPSKCPSAYRIDLHVDDEMSVYQNGIANGFRVYRITDDDKDWTENIWREIERIAKLKESN